MMTRRLGGAARRVLADKLGTQRLGKRRSSVIRGLAFGRIGVRTQDACGLVSRYGHHGPPL
jgi:hypothetical protein